MAEDHRCGYDKIADPAVAVVVHIRAAHPDRCDLDEHLVRRRGRHGTVLDGQVPDTGQHAGPHSLQRHNPIMPRLVRAGTAQARSANVLNYRSVFREI